MPSSNLSFRSYLLPAPTLLLCGAILLTYLAFHQWSDVFRKPAAQAFPAAQGVSQITGTNPQLGVSAPDSNAPMPDKNALAAGIDKIIAASPGKVRVSVKDGITSEVLYQKDQDQPNAPASLTKLFMSLAAVHALGANTQLETKAVQAGDTVYLVAGGDNYLGQGTNGTDVDGHAGLQSLTNAVVEKLKAESKTSINLGVDDTMFTGPQLRDSWNKEDLAGNLSPIYPLAFFGGLNSKDNENDRPDDAALSVGQVFKQQLEAAGITVNQISREKTPDQGTTNLGSIFSAPMTDYVEKVLTDSNNYVAESLGRLVAIKQGKGGAADQSPQAVLNEVKNMGINVDGVKLLDTSGMSESNVVTAEAMTSAIFTSVHSNDLAMRNLILGYPVAGVNGTLEDRFINPSSKDGAGYVRAKTGTLWTAINIAGTTINKDGRPLIFSVLNTGFPKDIAVQKQLQRETNDAIAALLTVSSHKS